MTMTRKSIKIAMRWALAAALVVAFLWAGHEDYTQEVVTEMQNNGAYQRFTAAQPDASDAELAEQYLAERGE